MKIRSLLLGSVAAAGLSTGAYAADLGVLTSLDVCDSLGLSGLTISSDTNCLQISGSVSYEFVWGDYEGPTGAATPLSPGDLQTAATNTTVITTGAGGVTIPTPGAGPAGAAANNDWHSKLESWIKFVATANSDFGPAKAVIKLKDVQYKKTINELAGVDSGDTGNELDSYTHGDDTGGVKFDEAYVQIGDATVLMAGKKGSIMNFGDDVPLNYLGLFNSDKVDKGVKWSTSLPDGGHVIQVVHDLGNGVSIGGALEKLDSTVPTLAGTAVGLIAYKGDGISAHLTLAAAGILDGVVENWGFHAGVSGTFDMVRFVAAIAGDQTGYYNALGSIAATFDMFTVALSGEAVNTSTGLDYGVGGSISAGVTDGVTINLGGRWYHDATGGGSQGAQVAAQLIAAVTETITLTAEAGAYWNSMGTANVFYGAGTVAWAPGGGFTSSLKGEAYSNGAYKATFKAAKTFE